MNTAVLLSQEYPTHSRARAVSTGLWVFMGVASTLFSLFVLAYVMRLSGSDGVAIALPWQLWLSTAWLLAGSVLLQAATRWRSHALFVAGGVCALAFLLVQWWAWAALQSSDVVLTSHPAASFFYVLTALHGLHVVGGLLAWTLTLRAGGWRIALCARYWHFLLAAWLVLFAALDNITPELARALCGVAS